MSKKIKTLKVIIKDRVEQFDWQIKAGSTAVTTIRKDNNEKPEITNGSKIIPAVGDHNYTLVLTEGERSVA